MHLLWARRGIGGGARTPVPRAGVCVCVWALGAAPPPVGGGPVARGVRGGALSPLRLPSSWGLSGPAAQVLWARVCGYGVRCEGRLRSGAPPPPTVRPLGGLSVRLHSCRGRGCAGVGARRCPVCLHALGGPRSVGVVGAIPGGLARHRCEGRLVPGAAPPPVARPLGGPSGSTTHMLWGRACGCWGPASSPRPACPVGAACREGGAGPPAKGLACHRFEGRLVSDAVPSPAARPLGRLAGVLRPVCPGCGRCGRGDPAPAPQRAPLRACVARRGGGGRASPGGCLPLLRGASDVRCSPSPDCPLTGRAVGVHYPRAVAVGAQRCPLGLHPLWGLLAAGVAGGRPWGGWPATILRGVWWRCPSPDRPSSGAGSWGTATLVFWVRSVRALGPSTGCSTACALAGWRCSLWGWRKGVPGGVPFTIVRGVWCQALSLPRPPVLWSGRPGFRQPCVPGAVGAGVVTQHRPHSVRPCGPALLAVGVAEGRPRVGCLPPLCEGRLRSGTVPPPTARPLGGLLGSATHMLWARVCGCGGPTLSPWPACPLGAACRGGAGGPSPGGWPATVVRGAWCQALSLPRPPVL